MTRQTWIESESGPPYKVHEPDPTPECHHAWHDGKSGHVCREPEGHTGPHVCTYCDEKVQADRGGHAPGEPGPTAWERHDDPHQAEYHGHP